MPGIDDDLGLNEDESKRLAELRDALESEFLTNESSADTRKSALNDIEDLKTDFLAALKHTVRHSQSDALKAKVAMWGYEKLLDQGKASADPIRELIEGMESARSHVKQKDAN
jgi:CHASE3 domain sensor protein